MNDIPYASIVESLMHVQTYTRPDISFAVEILGLYKSNPGTKYHMLTYRGSDHLDVIEYLY